MATGCYATRAESDLAGLPAVEKVVPNPQKLTVVATTAALLTGGEPTTADRFGDGDG